MADNNAMLRWLATNTGRTNLIITNEVSNPTSNPALLFNQTMPTDIYLHRVTIANDSSIDLVYVLQRLEVGGGASDWEDMERITVEPGLSWRGVFELALTTGEALRLAIVEDADATGTSIAIAEYLSKV